jgi:hypothetical protein
MSSVFVRTRSARPATTDPAIPNKSEETYWFIDLTLVPARPAWHVRASVGDRSKVVGCARAVETQCDGLATRSCAHKNTAATRRLRRRDIACLTPPPTRRVEHRVVGRLRRLGPNRTSPLKI